MTGIKIGYVSGLRCHCGGFNHSLYKGYCLICLFCGDRKFFKLLEGEDKDELEDDREQANSG